MAQYLETTPIMIYARVSIKLSAALSHTQTRRIYFIYFMCDIKSPMETYTWRKWLWASSCPWLWRFLPATPKSIELCNKIRKMHTRPFSFEREKKQGEKNACIDVVRSIDESLFEWVYLVICEMDILDAIHSIIFHSRTDYEQWR